MYLYYCIINNWFSLAIVTYPSLLLTCILFPQIPGKIKFTFTQQKRKGSSMRSSIHGSQTLNIPQMNAPSSHGSGQLVSTPYSSIGDIPGNLDPNVNLSPGIMGRPPLPDRTR